METKVNSAALLYPEWSSRELACHISNKCGFTISEFTVYRLLKARGLIKPVEVKTFPAGSEYTVKTRRPNEQRQTDATYMLVKNWGWYYMISVLDDFSRRIIAWRLQRTMTTEAFSEVIEQACEATGMDDVPTKQRARLVTDRGPALISRTFGGISGSARPGAYPGGHIRGRVLVHSGKVSRSGDDIPEYGFSESCDLVCVHSRDRFRNL